MVRFCAKLEYTKDEVTKVKTVNQYRLGSVVGSGTYCKVKWAEGNDGGRFAIKVFSKSVMERRQCARFDRVGASTISLREKIESELHILEVLQQHENITSLIEVINDPEFDKFYVVFEGLLGGPLMEWKSLSTCGAYGVNSDPSVVRQCWGSEVRCECGEADPKFGEIAVCTEGITQYLFRQLLQAVSYIHSRNVVHKDLKPDNVLLSMPLPAADPRFVQLLGLQEWPSVVARPLPPLESAATSEVSCTPAAGPGPVTAAADAGESGPGVEMAAPESRTVSQAGQLQSLLAKSGLVLKVSDFNTAVICDTPDCLIYDAEGTTLFSAPECYVDRDRGIDGKKRDVWSLGCILFVMLFGRCPFWAEEALALQIMIMMEDFTLPHGILTSQAEDLIRSLLRKDPAGRPIVTSALQHSWLQETGSV